MPEIMSAEEFATSIRKLFYIDGDNMLECNYDSLSRMVKERDEAIKRECCNPIVEAVPNPFDFLEYIKEGM